MTKKVGRPKGSVQTSTLVARKMREDLVKTVKKEFRPIIKSQIELAKGVYVEGTFKLNDGSTIKRYYKTKPDVSAAKNLIDQAIGKPQESLKVEGEIKTITEIVEDLNNN